MTIATTYSRAQIGIDAPLITVETHVSQGLPQVIIVGLPETAVKEAKHRVRAAILNSGFEMPKRRITVNLAPADLPKQGGRYDLAIAVGILGASGQLDVASIANFELLGELALGGDVRPVDGVLPAALKGDASGRQLVVPRRNGDEAAMSQHRNVCVVDTLKHLVMALISSQPLPVAAEQASKADHPYFLLSDIRGQYLAKRALTIAASGAHNLILVGPPGTGKTMLASRLPSLLPPMTIKESLAVASLQSVSKYNFDVKNWGRRPFRAPHHTASGIALVGGGSPPRPGEISLAHLGVLFLDELPEFTRQVLEVLREPLESGQIVISRAQHQVSFPARFQLVSAMNPCPCGYHGDGSDRCNCTLEAVERYRSRVSGPLMDRIDLHVEVPALPAGALSSPDFEPANDEHKRAVSAVARARQIMLDRQAMANAYLDSRMTSQLCRLSDQDQQLLENAMEKLGLSTRGYYKVLKVARTIADLEGSKRIGTAHIIEALGYRRLDRIRTSTSMEFEQ